MIKKAIHNEYECIFDEKRHIYTVNGKRLTSGTTFIKQFLPKFDAPAVAAKTAVKRGTTAEALLKEWREKGERASREGSLVHSYAEWIYSDDTEESPPYAIEDDNRVGLLTSSLVLAYDKLQAKKYKPVEAEKIIFSPSLGIAGMVDLLLIDPDGKIVILDWKTSEELKLDNPFQTCLPPIDHLEDANLTHYSLQLSLYQYILMQEGYYPAEQEYRRLIVHLMEDNYKIYSCRFLENEIESLLI